MVNIVGNHDGSSAVDYTVNPATGFPWATGPRNLSVPFNHLLPAWDAITGMMATASMLAAERQRTRTGEGQCVQLALSDVALWMVANLGKIAEVQINQHERPKDGNYLYGAFGRDFLTKDEQAGDDRGPDRAPVEGARGGHWPGRGVRHHRQADGRGPHRGGRPLRRARGDRSDAQALGAPADDGRAARDFDGTASPGGRTRRSPSSWRRTLAARPRTRCSRRWSSRGSART